MCVSVESERSEATGMEWSEIERAMVVFAHPDDAEFGSAGTASKMAAEGKDVVYVVVTDGSKGSSDPNATGEELKRIREEEQWNAARVIGVSDVCFLGFDDGLLVPSLDLRRAISGAIRRYRPDVVIGPNPVRDLSMTVFAQHPDHLAVGEEALAAVYPAARDRMTFPELLEQGLEPHSVKEIWIVGTGISDHFVDISDMMDVKMRALSAHVSQVNKLDVEKFVPERARQLGEGHGMQYAEAYRRIIIP
ncbi:MAG: PIG-L deacetylase family protein [Chloroflexota bacterium]